LVTSRSRSLKWRLSIDHIRLTIGLSLATPLLPFNLVSFSSYFTLKIRLGATRDHQKWHHSIGRIRIPIFVFHYNYGHILYRFYRATRMHSADCAVARCPSVRPSVCLSVCHTLSKWLYSHVSGLIRDRLHWLPVSQRIRFKLCLMMYKATHRSAPVYLSELCEQSCVEGRTRSSARGDLVVQRTRTKFGERAFVVAGPAAWNQVKSSQ